MRFATAICTRNLFVHWPPKLSKGPPAAEMAVPVVVKRICCMGAGYVGGSTCSVIACKCPDVDVRSDSSQLIILVCLLSLSQVTVVDLESASYRCLEFGLAPDL